MNVFPILSQHKLLVFVLIILLYACASPEGPRKAIAAQDRAMIQLPVRVYLLSFDAAPDLNSTYDEHEVNLLFGEVNAVWRKWGIEWVPETISTLNVDRNEFPGVSAQETKRGFRNKLAAIVPAKEGSARRQVAIFRQFPVEASGVYVREKETVFYGELNKDGKRFPIVLAHELGHALGLNHEKKEENLMYGGRAKNPEKTHLLESRQIDLARSVAKGGESSRPEGTPPSAVPSVRTGSKSGRQGSGAPSPEQRKKMARRLESFDSNGDGKIELTEVPPKAQRTFGRIDLDGNGSIDSKELDHFASP